MRKKLLSLALALMMCLGLTVPAFAAEGASADKFTDVPADAWYKEELNYATYNGFIAGTSENTFFPSGLVTRGQFVTILGRMLKVDTADYTSSNFVDVEAKSWYGPFVAWAADKGYVNGTSATTFDPGNNITFEQMGTILANYIHTSKVTLTGTKPIEQYLDAGSISNWAKDNMELMRQHDLLPVDGKGNIRPRQAVTRAEAAVSLVRLARATGLGEEPPIDITSGGTTGTVDSSIEQSMITAAVQNVHESLRNSGKITDSSSEKDKAIAYYEWMGMNCNYGGDSGETKWQSHSAYGALVNNLAVCDGLAKAYKLLLESEGIVCTLDTSKTHMWNVAVLDGTSYKIDPTSIVDVAKMPDGSYNSYLGQMAIDQTFLSQQEWRDKYGY